MIAQFLKRLQKSSLLIICIALLAAFGLFVYPGMYKYDKLNQKYPVKINRITGKTQVLYSNGWANLGNYDAATTEMEHYKREIEQSIADQEDRIKSSVIQSIQPELDRLDAAASTSVSTPSVTTEDVQSDAAQTEESRDYFIKGDSVEFVEKLMGTPDKMNEAMNYQVWSYGLSSITFKDGAVNGWDNLGKNLKLK